MMAARSINLRIKSKTGQCVVGDLTLDSTLSDLNSQVSLLMQIPVHSLKLLHGFPPKPVDMCDRSKSLQQLNFRSGDTVIAQEDTTIEREEHAPINVTHNDVLQTSAQAMITRECVPANNACLFTSFNFVMTGGQLDLSSAQPMRDLIANVVSSNPHMYNEVLLGRTNDDYCKWIRESDSWGGAIEVSILSAYHQIEVDVVDTQSLHISRFGEDHNYPQRVLLIYDGIHYDPLKLETFDSSLPPRTKFSTKDEDILQQALQLATEAKASRQYTDVGNLSLRCLTCNTGLAGQIGAEKHAKETGHINFGEL